MGVSQIGQNHLRAQSAEAATQKKRAPLSFRQRDLTRALKGAEKAGCKPSRFTVDNSGNITVDLVAEETDPPLSSAWERALANDEDQ